MAELLSQAAYARHRNISAPAVNKAIKAGRITLINGQIDPEVADIQWSRNTDVLQQSRSGTIDIPAQSAIRASPQNDNAVPTAGSDLYDARTRSEQARAELFEIEESEKRGELVKADAVTKAAFEKARLARSALEAIPDRLAPVLAAESDPATCYQLLTGEIKRVLRELSEDQDR